VRLKKGNLARIDLSGATPETIASDGERLWRVDLATRRYRESRALPDGKKIHVSFSGATPITLFFQPEFLETERRRGAKLRLLPEETVDGVRYRVLRVSLSERDLEAKVKVFVGPDGLVHGLDGEGRQAGKQSRQQAWLRQIETNRPMTAEEFRFTPPADAFPENP